MDWGEIKLGDLSGWAQFVGGVLSICAAWAIARSQQRAADRAQEQDRLLRAHAIASAAVREIENVVSQALGLDEVIAQLESTEHGPVLIIARSKVDINEPRTISTMSDQLYVLGADGATALFKLLSTIASLKKWAAERERVDLVSGQCVRIGTWDVQVVRQYRLELGEQAVAAAAALHAVLNEVCKAEEVKLRSLGQFSSRMIGYWRTKGRN